MARIYFPTDDSYNPNIRPEPSAPLSQNQSAPARVNESTDTPQNTKTIHRRECIASTSKKIKSQLDADVLYKKAYHELRDGNLLKAFHLFRQSVKAGSEIAKRWIVPNNTNPSVPDYAPVEGNICQDAILGKFKQILEQLKSSNTAYKEDAIEKILIDLIPGHCYGFSLFYAQMALQKADPLKLNSLRAYHSFCQFIIHWDGEVFEAPKGFSYSKYRAGDKQGITPEQEERMHVTTQIIIFIQIIRYAQQKFHEAIEWSKSLPHHDELEAKGLLQYIPLSAQHDILGILGQDFTIPMQLFRSGSIGSESQFFINALKANLADNNVALLSFPTTIPQTGKHIVTILFRNNLYYLFDSNTRSDEDNYDPNYSARYYTNLELLYKQIKKKYKGVGDLALTFIERKDAENLYIHENDWHLREILLTYGDFVALYGESLFNKFFPVDTDTLTLTPKIFQEISDQHIDIRTFFQHQAFYNRALKTVDCLPVTLNVETWKALILAFPTNSFKTNDTDFIAEAYYRLGVDCQTGADLPGLSESRCFFMARTYGHPVALALLLIEYETKKETEPSSYSIQRLDELRALLKNDIRFAFHYVKQKADLDDPEAQMEVANFYANGTGTEKDLSQWLHYIALSSKNNNTDAMRTLANAYQYGLNGLAKNLEKAIDFYIKIIHVPGVRSLFNQASIQLFKTRAKSGSTQAMLQLGDIYEMGRQAPKDYKKALRYYQSAAEQGEKTAYCRMAQLYESRRIPAIEPEQFRALLSYVEDTLDGLCILTRAYLTGDILMRDLAQANYWYNRARLADDTTEMHKLNRLEELRKLIAEADA